MEPTYSERSYCTYCTFFKANLGIFYWKDLKRKAWKGLESKFLKSKRPNALPGSSGSMLLHWTWFHNEASLFPGVRMLLCVSIQRGENMLIKAKENIDHCHLFNMFSCLIQMKDFKSHLKVVKNIELENTNIVFPYPFIKSEQEGRYSWSPWLFPCDLRYGSGFKLNLHWGV